MKKEPPDPAWIVEWAFALAIVALLVAVGILFIRKALGA